MKFLLMTTSILSEKAIKELERLFNSIEESENRLEKIKHIVLLQNFTEEYQFFIEKHSRLIDFMTFDSKMSLSKARNLMLAKARKEGTLTNVDIIAYPDDDCWYTKSFLEYISSIFASKNNLDFLFCKYSSKPVDALDSNKPKKAKITDLIKNASSNTIFVRSNIAINAGGFDESLGVGTPNNGGEDLDYAIKLFLSSRSTEFIDNELVGHRDKILELKEKYFQGSHIALRKHAFKKPTLFYQWFRKLIVGIVLIIKGDMNITKLMKAKY
ncbi:hypothetical protein [Endozoicomonas sp. ALB032]|uniref:hypothetical protein n=1 Tax=Endozoicomonas sp. ALB032 TaxID=3403082 RepID=UPI003BB4F065